MITISQGDTVTLQLTAANGDGVEVDLTGATFTTQIRSPNGVLLTIPNADHTADPDQVANTGEFTISLTSAQTKALELGRDKEIVTKIVQGGSTIHYHAENILTVLNNFPVK